MTSRSLTIEHTLLLGLSPQWVGTLNTPARNSELLRNVDFGYFHRDGLGGVITVPWRRWGEWEGRKLAVKDQSINFHNVLQEKQKRVILPIPQAGPQTVIKSTTDYL